MGDFEKALPYADRAYELQSSLPDDNFARISALFTLGLCLWRLDSREEAETHLVEALAFFRTNPIRFANQIAQLEELGL
jgi:tetratricopeptide (TPR) repeat protein